MLSMCWIVHCRRYWSRWKC